MVKNDERARIMKRTILTYLFMFMLIFGVFGFLAACGEEEAIECTAHSDTNKDKKCDKCNIDYIAECTRHFDTDNNQICDYCGDELTVDAPNENEPPKEDGSNENEPPTEDGSNENEPPKEDGSNENEPPTEDGSNENEPPKEDGSNENEPPAEDGSNENEPPAEDGSNENEPPKEDGSNENSPPAENNPSEDITDGAIPPDAVVLIKDGEALFKIVITDGISLDAQEAVTELVANLSALNITVEVAKDSTDTLSDCEILIGEVKSRGDKYILDSHTYGWEGYTVKAIDGKILILGGSDEATADAISDFEREILGIKKSTTEISSAYMTEDDNIEKIQTEFKVESITLSGNSIKDYSIVASSADENEISAARVMQEQIYKRSGIWLSIVEPSERGERAIIVDLTSSQACPSDKGFIATVNGGDLIINCGFGNKIGEAILAFLTSEITYAGTANPVLAEGYVYEKYDCRNIYYKDFGAIGDGETDDFYAIKATHDYANEWGHTVNADEGKIYYLGKGSGYDTITVNTNTNWHGASFIIDDSEISAPSNENGYIKDEGGDPEFYTPVFTVEDTSVQKIKYGKDDEKPINSLAAGAENIGFAPGYRALIVLYNDNVERYIRYGSALPIGDAQQEIVIVEADGSIDSQTPIEWDYEVVTSMEIYELSDTPITISGGEDEIRACFNTVINTAPATYTFYERNIKILRSCVTVNNIEHSITENADTTKGAPYSGFLRAQFVDDLLIENCVFQLAKLTYSDYATGTSPSYEIHAEHSNNVVIKNCTQSNFFIKVGGSKAAIMSSVYVKNLKLDSVVTNKLIAGCGMYNLTVLDSIFGATLLIGGGELEFKNVTVYENEAINFDSRYGSSWRGNMKIDGLCIKFSSGSYASVVNSEWNAGNPGYESALPEIVEISNVKTVLYSVFEDYSGVNQEKTEAENNVPLYLYYKLNKYTDRDISIPDTAQPSMYQNPYAPTKELYITNSAGLTLILPSTPQFKDMKVYVDGEAVEWKTTGKIEIPKE